VGQEEAAPQRVDGCRGSGVLGGIGARYLYLIVTSLAGALDCRGRG